MGMVFLTKEARIYNEAKIASSINDAGKTGELHVTCKSYMSTSLVAQMAKHLPIMQETWVRSLGLENHLEKEMATHSSTLAWKIPWMEKPGRLWSMGSQRVGHD